VNNLLLLALAFAAGIVLGTFFFYGLWLTVRKLPLARRPVVMSLSSFFGRLAIVLVGFYFITAGRWERLAVCLVGFLAARMVLVKIFGPQGKSSKSDSQIKAAASTDLKVKE
jgi:F1F0 ATPase subunit 2